jgi:lipopolysaccharide heptosyltransferase II
MNKIFIKIITLICCIFDKTIKKTSLNKTEINNFTSIYSFWHGNTLPMMIMNKKKKIVVMISLSKDGDFLSKVIQKFGYIVVRGSSSKNGVSAIIESVKYIEKKYSLALAVDGPKGPYHKVKHGVIYLAKKTGIPIIPIICSSRKKIVLKSWDKFVIPFPFSKIVQIYGEPIYIDKNDNVAEKSIILEEKINELFNFVDKYYWSKNIQEYLRYHPHPKFLIIQPSRIGDIIFSIPILPAIKKKYPNSTISWVVDKRCFDILKDNVYLDDIIIWDKKNISISYYKKIFKQLRRNKFDVSIDLHGLAKSAMFVKFANARFKLASISTYGMKELSWLFSKKIKSQKTCHCVDSNFKVAEYLGCDYEINFPIVVKNYSYQNMIKKLSIFNVNLKKIIGIHIGGGWISRRWEYNKFSVLSKKIKFELGADVVIVGGEVGGTSEYEINKKVIMESGFSIINMINKFSLNELCAFLKVCKVFVGNDSGPIHIASALNTHVVAILGPTNSLRTGPYGNKSKVIQHYIDCQPCRNRNCKKVKCMESITVNEVFEEVKKKFNMIC